LTVSAHPTPIAHVACHALTPAQRGRGVSCAGGLDASGMIVLSQHVSRPARPRTRYAGRRPAPEDFRGTV